MFNTPLTCLSTPHGLRIDQDFRQLNQKLVASSLSFKQVHEALGSVKKEKSIFFTTLDLSAAAWQLKLCKQQWEIMSFSCPGVGQFEWVQAPNHFAGAEATFHRLLDATLGDLPGTIPQINRIIIHSASMEEHLNHDDQILPGDHQLLQGPHPRLCRTLSSPQPPRTHRKWLQRSPMPDDAVQAFHQPWNALLSDPV
jgi:hypothetical protein